MSRIVVNPNEEIAASIRWSLKQNGWYCPCRTERTPDTKCPCKEFREQTTGECHCGLYIKVDK